MTNGTSRNITGGEAFLLGIFYLVMGVFLGYCLYSLWPIYITYGPEVWVENVRLFCWNFFCPKEVRLLLIAMVCGGIGGFVHGIRSFADFLGNRKLTRDWLWWYVIKVPVGASLAAFFYFLLSAGIFSLSGDVDKLGHSSVAAVSALVGLFSDDSMIKLAQIFRKIINYDDDREGKLKSTEKTQKGKDDKNATSTSYSTVRSSHAQI